MIRLCLLIIVLFTALPGTAGTSLLEAAWPASAEKVADVGRGVAVVFTPDLSVDGNCRFYNALGFACFEDSDWGRVIDGIHAFNESNPDRPIQTVLLETHGTNGNGLKLQRGKKGTDERSYIAVAALEERLEPAGVRHIILSACNSGRLLRPQIYRKLDRNSADPLFLPATLGIIDATESFDPDEDGVTVLTPGSSHIETTLIGSIRELPPATRHALDAAATAQGMELPPKFAISEMLIRILTRAPDLELRTGVHVEDLSGVQSSPETSERLFRAFVAHLVSLHMTHVQIVESPSRQVVEPTGMSSGCEEME